MQKITQTRKPGQFQMCLLPIGIKGILKIVRSRHHPLQSTSRQQDNICRLTFLYIFLLKQKRSELLSQQEISFAITQNCFSALPFSYGHFPGSVKSSALHPPGLSPTLGTSILSLCAGGGVWTVWWNCLSETGNPNCPYNERSEMRILFFSSISNSAVNGSAATKELACAMLLCWKISYRSWLQLGNEEDWPSVGHLPLLFLPLKHSNE